MHPRLELFYWFFCFLPVTNPTPVVSAPKLIYSSRKNRERQRMTKGRQGARGLVRQGWVVDWAPTDLQNGPTDGGVSAHLCRSNSYPLRPHRVTWIKTKREGVWRADAPVLSNRTSKLGLSCKVNKCSDAGTADPGVLTTQETSPWFSLGDAGSIHPEWMPPQDKKRKNRQ